MKVVRDGKGFRIEGLLYTPGLPTIGNDKQLSSNLLTISEIEWLAEQATTWQTICKLLSNAHKVGAMEIAADIQLREFVEKDDLEYDPDQKVFFRLTQPERDWMDTQDPDPEREDFPEPLIEVPFFDLGQVFVRDKKFNSSREPLIVGHKMYFYGDAEWLFKLFSPWKEVAGALLEAKEFIAEVKAEELARIQAAEALENALTNGVFEIAGFKELGDGNLEAEVWAGKNNFIKKIIGKVGSGPYMLTRKPSRIPKGDEVWVMETLASEPATHRLVAFVHGVKSRVSELSAEGIELLGGGMLVFKGSKSVTLWSGVLVIGIWPVDQIPCIRVPSFRGYNEVFDRGFVEITFNPQTKRFEEKFISETAAVARDLI